MLSNAYGSDLIRSRLSKKTGHPLISIIIKPLFLLDTTSHAYYGQGTRLT